MRNFILGTDWWTDCDDAVALRLLTRHLREEKIHLLGIVLNACMPYSVASVCGFLRADGIKDIPIGIDREATDFGGRPPYQKRLAENYAPELTNADAEDAVRLYRRLLASSREPVEMIEIGFLQTVVALLESEPDDLSPLDGLTLVREKVSRMWVMAGKWDADGEREHNFCLNDRSRRAGKRFCELCPVPVTFLGWEVGVDVISGRNLSSNDPLYSVLADHGSPNGRSSWDPMLVHMALIGSENAAGYSTVSGHASVDADTGSNHFCTDPNGPHCYVVKARENSAYELAIDSLLN